MLAAGAGALDALWLLPALAVLHLSQLLISSRAWQVLLPMATGLGRFYRLRIVREGIDSLLPVAQVGGEVVGAHLLSRGGDSLAAASASVVVDVTVEFLSQLGFLVIGIAVLATTSPAGIWQAWVGVALLTAAFAGMLLAAQRFGLLRSLELLARQIAVRFSLAGSLEGMTLATAAIYRRRASLIQAFALHLVAWLLGTIESWAVLQNVGVPVTITQALVVESLGMAARSAGFAVPGALVVQETGFALAAVAAGVPETAGLALSLVKRVREVAVGAIGLALWWAERTPTRGKSPATVSSLAAWSDGSRPRPSASGRGKRLR